MPHAAFSQTHHRPWPCPERPWTWRQSWCDLLFAHWPVEPALLLAHLPAGLELDEFEQQAWLGIVPFRMQGVMRRPLCDLPWISAFPEVNLRTYVRVGDKPGVWFFSLDATNSLAVWAARRFFHLPYYRAEIEISEDGDWLDYSCRRRQSAQQIALRYRPSGDAYTTAAGSLEHWLTERYCLYAADRQGRLTRTEVQHEPWPLQTAVAEWTQNNLAEPLGVTLAGAPLLHFARRLDVVVWSPEQLVDRVD